jgi:hypothetical protein
MQCEYCRRLLEEGATNCPKCGAPVSVVTISKKPETTKGYPFLFHGFMIWPETDYSRNLYIHHVWLGDRLIGSIEVTSTMLHAWRDEHGWDDISICYDDENELLYKLLRLAIGETEVEKYEQLNKPRQFVFEITRHETEEFEEARKLIKELMNV